MSTIELTSGSATLTARADYLLVVEHGTLSSAAEVYRYVTELELASQRFHLRRLLVDARSETDEGAAEAREAMWRWMRSQRTFDQLGYVLRDEMTIARVNMTALSEKLPVRAFAAVADGHRWLTRATKGSSTSISAVRGPSSVPPPSMGSSATPIPVPRSALPPAISVPSFGAGGSSTTRLPASAVQTSRNNALSTHEADAIAREVATPTQPIPRIPGASVRASEITGKTSPVDADAADALLRKRR